jgi:methylenetetrahydrofolate dehydrogenase (NADP+)/methenyltetrahydrofolate cyclohydrolase
MTAKVIDGKEIAAQTRAKVAAEVARLLRDHKVVPGLAVVLVGKNPASEVYVGSKKKMTVEAGMKSFDFTLPETASEAELLALIDKLNKDPAVNGILVQLPLPDQIDANKVISAIDPGKPALVPCTPLGCVILAKSVVPSLAGMEAVVVGRSNIVGKPLAALLIAESATVTVAHSRTKDLPDVCRRADLLFAAVGRPEMIKGDWVRPGAIVIDVGINRVPSATPGKSKIVGDVAYAECAERASAITPVPGGVGPMTIACLLVNTLRAACVAHGLPAPAV